MIQTGCYGRCSKKNKRCQKKCGKKQNYLIWWKNRVNTIYQLTPILIIFYDSLPSKTFKMLQIHLKYKCQAW